MPPRRRPSTSVLPSPASLSSQLPTPPRPRPKFRARDTQQAQASSPEPSAAGAKPPPPPLVQRFGRSDDDGATRTGAGGGWADEKRSPGQWTPDELEHLYRAILRRERWDVIAELVGHSARECAAKWKDLDARLVVLVRSAADPDPAATPHTAPAAQSDTDRLGDDEWELDDHLATDFDDEAETEDGETEGSGGGGAAGRR